MGVGSTPAENSKKKDPPGGFQGVIQVVVVSSFIVFVCFCLFLSNVRPLY